MNKKKIVIEIVVVVTLIFLTGGYFAYGKVNDFLIASKEKEESFEAMKTQLETKIEEQEVKIEELEGFRDEQVQVEEDRQIEEKEEEKKEEKENVTAQNKATCEKSKEYCDSKIYDAKRINYKGKFESVFSIDESKKSIRSLEMLLDKWEDDRKDCDSFKEEDIENRKICFDSVDERIDKTKKDIKEIEELTEEAEEKVENLLKGECKDYKHSCE
ncbi:MAG: hypothetical protein OEV93_03290 [Candidatus Moranbacteria bacterium]|nr:hypothetical protein [Candidatus Moranbacteria bacterium]